MNTTAQECNPGLDCNNGNEIDCCHSQVICKIPQDLNDITTDCIFAEKVFDARITKNELQFGGAIFLDNVEPSNLVTIETINVECNVLSTETFTANVNINGEFIDISTTVSGPGGTQVVLNREQLKAIQDNNCAKKGKGTKVQLDLLNALLFDLEVIVTGTGIDDNGLLVPFSASQVSSNVIGLDLSLKDFCIPPVSIFPISLISSCLMDCDLVVFDFTLFPDQDQLDLLVGIILCIPCETLLKVPSQLCTLTTGPCKIKKSKSFCNDDDFPNNFAGTLSNKNVTSSMKKTSECDNKMDKRQAQSIFGTNRFNINSNKKR